MRQSVVKMTDLVESTCPHYNSDFSGHCEDCNQRTDCMMKAILQKLRSLEAMIAEINAG